MTPKAVVVGAGLSGLVCAHRLIEVGFDVTVLEAQSRPGGRIRTMRAQFADHMYCEAGAMGFLDIHPRVKALVAQCGLTAPEFKSETSPTIFYLRGRRIFENPAKPALGIQGLPPAEAQLGIDGIWQKYVGDPSQRLGNPSDSGWSPAPFADLDAVSAADFLRAQGASAAAVQLINRGLSGLYGDGLDSYSALILLLGAALMQDAKSDFEILGGNEALPLSLARKIATNVRYGLAATSIAQTSTGVSVSYASPHLAQPATIDADYVVCAIPFPLVASLQFTPALPPMIQEMAKSVGNTSVTRTFIQTRTRFWSNAPNGADNLELSLSHARVMSGYNQPGIRGILEVYMAGPAARDIDQAPEGTRVQTLLSTINQSLPQASAEFEGGSTFSWNADPWAKGGYAFYRPGQFTRYWNYLATPVGRIRFCGDQTSIWVGWMEGAVLSGERAAKEIISAATAAGLYGGTG